MLITKQIQNKHLIQKRKFHNETILRAMKIQKLLEDREPTQMQKTSKFTKRAATAKTRQTQKHIKRPQSSYKINQNTYFTQQQSLEDKLKEIIKLSHHFPQKKRNLKLEQLEQKRLIQFIGNAKLSESSILAFNTKRLKNKKLKKAIITPDEVSEDFSTFQIDASKQNIKQLYNLSKGGYAEFDKQYSKSLNISDFNIEKQNFKYIKDLYNQTKVDLRRKKIDEKNIEKGSLMAVVYLNQRANKFTQIKKQSYLNYHNFVI